MTEAQRHAILCAAGLLQASAPTIAKNLRDIEQAARATPADHSAIVRMLEGYAESYEMMARQEKDATVRCSSVAVDIRQNMAKWVRDRGGPADHIVDANKKVDADSVPAAIYQVNEGCVRTGDLWRDVAEASYEPLRIRGYQGRIVYDQAPQPEAQSVRDAVIEECAKVIDSYADRALDCDPQFALDLCSDAVRDLKSAPPQKPEDAS